MSDTNGGEHGFSAGYKAGLLALSQRIGEVADRHLVALGVDGGRLEVMNAVRDMHDAARTMAGQPPSDPTYIPGQD